MNHGSLFTGVGGFDLGFEAAGFETAWQAEYDPTPRSLIDRRPRELEKQFCCRVLRERFPGVPNLGDVNTIRRPAKVDVLSFGSPCQDLSVAGRRAGLDGARSGLFFQAARIIDECRPDFGLWENVPGAFSSNGGRDFLAVLDTLAELGAADVAWRVFDSQYAGVPQQRRRIYLVADFRGHRAAEVLFDPEGCGGHYPALAEAGEGPAGAITSRARRSGRGGEDDYNLTVSKPLGTPSPGGFRFDLDHDTYVVDQPVPAVTSKWAKGSGGLAGDETQNLILIQDARNMANKAQNGDGIRLGDVAYTLDQAVAFTGETAHALTSEGADASEDGTGRGTPIVAYDERQITSKGNRSQGRADGSYTLNPGGLQMFTSPTAIRRCTPVECERLQGFPDGWTCLCGAGADMFACTCSDGPRYRALGNAATTTVPYWIAARLARYF